MKDRGLVIFVTIVSIVIFSIVGLLLVISNLNQNTNVIVSYPVSYTNSIRIVPKELEKYNYVGIDKDNVLTFVDLSGETKIITLENKEWKNIKWSPDNTLVSVLGKVNNIYNLFIYDLSQEKLEQITFYNDSDISNFSWINDDELIYIQGEGSSRWLHSYKYSTKAQLLKINRVDGELVRIDNSNSIYIYETTTSFDLRDKMGKLISKLSKEFTKDIYSFNISEVLSLNSLDDLILKDSDNNVYLYNLISDEIKQLEINFFDDLHLLCSLDSNQFNLYTKNINSLEVLKYDLTYDLLEMGDIITSNYEALEGDTLKSCRDNKYLINANVDGELKWFIDDESFKEILILKDYIDIDYKY